jgi:hypothetical protein
LRALSTADDSLGVGRRQEEDDVRDERDRNEEEDRPEKAPDQKAKHLVIFLP